MCNFIAEYNQSSFVGGMNLLADDTRLGTNMYRVGFNLRNRFDVLSPVPSSVQDLEAPPGIKQECVSFGQYVILFAAGKAYYRYYNEQGWTPISGFSMDPKAPRYWTCEVPLATTNYGRISISALDSSGNPIAVANQGAGIINVNSIAAAGNIPGLLVQDNLHQPQFIFISPNNGTIQCRTTQTYQQWTFTISSSSDSPPYNVTVDKREYVPIGNVMCWNNGVLYIASQDGYSIYRSVTGRPLDFVVNVTADDATGNGGGQKGGDATTTSYSVGVGGITCLRSISSGSILVTAGNSNFSVAQNTTPNAPTIFGEYTFIRTFLFNATCLSDRAIFDSVGDTRFISLTGIRSFNAVEQTQNEGRNSAFSSAVQGAFGDITATGQNAIIQSASAAAAILYNDCEYYAVQTIFGPSILVYDTVIGSWASFDLQQTGGKAVKMLVKIELDILALFAVTVDDNIYQLYASPTKFDTAAFITPSVSSTLLYANYNIKLNNPKTEIKPTAFRVSMNASTESTDYELTTFVNNRLTVLGTKKQTVPYAVPAAEYDGPYVIPYVNTQLNNLRFDLSGCKQGWKVYFLFTWTDGYVVQFSVEAADLTPGQSLSTQASKST